MKIEKEKEKNRNRDKENGVRQMNNDREINRAGDRQREELFNQ